jgi:hypothetical protein
MVYLGATEEQIAAHRSALGQTGQESPLIATQSKEPAEDRLGKAIAGSQKIVFSGSASVNKPVHAL